MNTRGPDWTYGENKILLAAMQSGASIDSVMFDLQAIGSNRTQRSVRVQAHWMARKKGIAIGSWWKDPNRKPTKKGNELPIHEAPTDAPQTVAVALSEEKPIEEQLEQFSDRERAILRAYYPRWGADAVLRHLLEERFFRSIEDIEAEAQRIGIARN